MSYSDHRKKADDLNVPLIEPVRRISRESNPVVAVCGECGREVRRIEIYMCGNSNCPLMPSVTL